MSEHKFSTQIWFDEKELADLKAFLVNSKLGWIREGKHYVPSEDMENLLDKVHAAEKHLEHLKEERE